METESTNYISNWISNHGLTHLPQNIFSFLDINSLTNCHSVSKIWNKVLNENKTLVLLQINLRIIELKNVKWRRFNGKLLSISDVFLQRMNSKMAKVYHSQNPETLEEEWLKLYKILQLESIDSLQEFWKHFKKKNVIDRINRKVYKPQEFCIRYKLQNIFEKYLKSYPLSLSDMNWIVDTGFGDPQSMISILQNLQKHSVNIRVHTVLDIVMFKSREEDSINMLKILLVGGPELGINIQKSDLDNFIWIAKCKNNPEMIELLQKYTEIKDRRYF